MSDPFVLTPRQREVLTLAALGYKEFAIARRLGLAQGTVSGYLWVARQRLGAASTAHAVAIAVVHGLIDVVPWLCAGAGSREGGVM